MTGPVKATRSRRFRNDSGIALRALTDPRFSTERNAVCRCCVTGHAPADSQTVQVHAAPFRVAPSSAQVAHSDVMR